jgi:hypothetical protein
MSLNPKAAFRAWAVTSGTSLYTLVGTRIRQDMLSAGFNNTQAEIVFSQISGGPDIDTSEICTAVISCRCYGGSDLMVDADAVAEALIARCHRAYGKPNTTYGTISAMHVMNKIDSADPDEGWPVVIVMLQITVV